MGRFVHVLVTCANRKTADPASPLTLRTVPRSAVEGRCKTWIRRLKAGTSATLSAEELYAGDHWQVVRSLQASLKRDDLSVIVWIVSAGYGLIPLSARIRPYSATFSTNHPDSVAPGGEVGTLTEARRSWWKALANWEGPAPGSARSVAALASEHKNSSLLLAASPAYLDALADDVQEAARALADPERLSIFSAGSEKSAWLPKNFIACDARLRQQFGGSLGSLNVRCVRFALEKLNGEMPSAPGLQRLFSRTLRKQPDLPRLARSPLSDEEVDAYIRAALAEDPSARPTPLLRRLRDSGRACEHSRFTSLFRNAERGSHG